MAMRFFQLNHLPFFPSKNVHVNCPGGALERVPRTFGS